MKSYSGVRASDGIAIGPALVWEKRRLVLRRRVHSSIDVDVESQRVRDAIEMTTRELLGLRDQLRQKLGEDHAQILDAQVLILEDEGFVGRVEAAIREKTSSAELAVSSAMAEILVSLNLGADRVFGERILDFRDVEQRLLRALTGGGEELPVLKEPSVLLAHQLTPSETAALDVDRILGFCIEEDGANSHTAIIARSLGVPAVMGVRGLLAAVENGTQLAVDGARGQVYVEPDAELRRRLSTRMERQAGVDSRLRELRHEKAITPDGHSVELSANIELPLEIDLAIQNGAESIGLVRTEFFYFQSARLPDEEEQYVAYCDVLQRAAGRNVIFRVLDVGGDKLLTALGSQREYNPFLGWRGVRFLLSNPEILHAQLRALYRASATATMRIMFPMISSVDELRALNRECLKCQEELRAEGMAFDPTLELGIMVETPSAVAMAKELAAECQFFSIGTNDLTQYILAVDRTNPRVAYLYQAHHPAVLRAIRSTIDAAHGAGIWAGICGEMGSNPPMAALLLGLGIDEISCNAASIPIIKKLIRTIDYAKAKKWADEALLLSTADEVDQYVRARAQRQLRGFLHP